MIEGVRAETFPARGFSQEGVEALSARLEEPAWMLEKRYQGWYHYREMEPPLWRRNDIAKRKRERLMN